MAEHFLNCAQTAAVQVFNMLQEIHIVFRYMVFFPWGANFGAIISYAAATCSIYALNIRKTSRAIIEVEPYNTILFQFKRKKCVAKSFVKW